ncbi:MAG: bifunctional glutamate--cysteine ligase GshA/glutathione synthetase GshB [Clostridium perfringens]|nr:bifunctional glutamate--cysteine ligase GshA/glutathione synthetase GshB [Clostridium perfringens]
MLEKVRELISGSELLKGGFGVELESLRVDKNGVLSSKMHPNVFGDKLENPYITTDFSESQVEMITPVMKSSEEVFQALNVLYDIVSLEIKDEYLWPESMPCVIENEEDIMVAKYSSTKKGNEAREYREGLVKKYGAKKQLISGIHYNFSFNEMLIKKLFEKREDENISYKEFKDSIYLKVTRNYLRYRWFIVYILGASPVIHKSYDKDMLNNACKINHEIYGNNSVISYRNSSLGYKNNTNIYPSYKSVKSHIESLDNLVWDKVISNYKELYSQIRLKAKDNYNLKKSLLEDGINYLEIRSIDINPLAKVGITLEDLKFINLFTLFLLNEDESGYNLWQEEALNNQLDTSLLGLGNIKLLRDGESISKENWGNYVLEKMSIINKDFNLNLDEIIDDKKNVINDYKNTYSYKIREKIKEEGFVNFNLNLSKKYKELAYNNRFKLEGFEDLELSTQILMKEAIKRGIKTKVVDRNDNFISLEKGDIKEYVKQATKTSKDNYITVLVMENKVVTKKVLDENNIKVPKGKEFTNIEEAKLNIDDFVGKPSVIKPKSTNFGIGISIFPDGASKKDLDEGLKIAFNNDNTVLVEEFIKGKEYRFLVIDDKVCGILHRVPANCIGDGEKSIRELIEIKNQSSLRGKGYKKPLEKIVLDDNAKLFLKQRGLDFEYVPKKDEVVYLRENSNISTGGDSIDYTDLIPEKFKKIAIKAAKAAKAKICGVDMMLENYEDENSPYAIIELNFNPAIHIHSYPYKGTERNIAREVLKLLELI